MDDEQQYVPKRINGAWVLFAATIVINLGVAAATLWVKSGYVPKSEFETYKAEQLQKREEYQRDLKAIAISLAEIAVEMKGNDRQDRRLDDVERRLGEQERKR